MAEQASPADRGSEATGIVGAIANAVFLPFEMIGTAVGKAWNAIMADGVIASFGRQGIDELGAALKAFPDSIQREETGTLWSPTQAEITASRHQGRHAGGYRSYSSLTPPQSSEATDHNRHQPELDHGHDNGHEHDAGHSM